MQGYNALWIPGTDHAAISTEVKVTNQLKEEGIDKKELGREKFLERTWQWKEEYAGTIEGQLKKLGVSCDWDRERFTCLLYTSIWSTFLWSIREIQLSRYFSKIC